MSADLFARLEQLGPVSRAGNTYRAACPVCARGRGDSALSIRLESGRVLAYCHRCESSYLELLAALGLDPRDLAPSSDWTPPARVEPTPDEDQRLKLERLWNEAFELDSRNAGGRYLEHRGLSLERYPANVRVHGQVGYWHSGELLGYFPALLARVENRAGELMALHRTFLAPDGSGKANVPSPKKLSRSVLEGGVMGCAIRLQVAGERLVVAEGIETTLAVHQATRLPSWAAVSAGGLERLEWPLSVSELLIAADHDANGRGLQAAHVLARRALEAGLTVRLAVPAREGTDWLDALLEGEVSGLLEAPTLTRSDVPKSDKPVQHDKSIWGQTTGPMSSNASILSSNQSSVWDTVSTPNLERSSDLGTHLGTSHVLKSFAVWERPEGIWGQALPPHSGNRENGGER